MSIQIEFETSEIDVKKKLPIMKFIEGWKCAFSAQIRQIIAAIYMHAAYVDSLNFSPLSRSVRQIHQRVFNINNENTMPELWKVFHNMSPQTKKNPERIPG